MDEQVHNHVVPAHSDIALEAEQEIRSLRAELGAKALTAEAVEAHGGTPYSQDEIDLAAVTTVAVRLAGLNQEIVGTVMSLQARMTVLHNGIMETLPPEKRGAENDSILGLAGETVHGSVHRHDAPPQGAIDTAGLHTGNYL